MFLISLTVTQLCKKMGKPKQRSQPCCGNQDLFGCDEDEEEKKEEEEDERDRFLFSQFLYSQESEADTEDSDGEERGRSLKKNHLGGDRDTSQSGFLQKLTVFLAGLKILCGGALNSAGKVVAMLLLGLAGVVLPSVTSAVYFLVFLGLCSWWSCHRPVTLVAFNSLCVMIAIFGAGHLILLYLYQLPFFQDLVPSEDIFAR
ncbi:hypothetical protein lerEdw1_002112 [Lerista edwardsae]|nr:hypothetical protein lerEdw1_002112 [Lerista edwardsae]